MEVKQHNIEVNLEESTAVIDWSNKVFEVQLENIDFEDYIQQEVEESYLYDINGDCERSYDSIADYLEINSASSVVQDILRYWEVEQFLSIANEIKE